MINFYCNRRHSDGTPFVKDAAIVAFAEKQLRDYRPELLEKPGKIDPDHFIDDSWDIRTAFLNYPDKVLVTPGQDS